MPPSCSVKAATNRLHVDRLMRDARADAKHKLLNLWNWVLENELKSDSQFLISIGDEVPYIVIGETHEIVSLPRASRGGDNWNAYFHTYYGFVASDPKAKFIYDCLRSHIITHGTRVDLRRFAVFDTCNHIAYISGYNGQMWKIISETEISQELYGVDGVFFADDDGGHHVEPDIGHHGELLELLTGLNFLPEGLAGITAQQQKMALTAWMLSVAFPDFMQTKPVLLLEGIQGSGKTACCSLLQLVLFGVSRPLMLQRKKEDDFAVQLVRSPIALFDNIDSYIDWVPDAIASYCTGGIITKRKLYTDDGVVTIKAHSFVAVTTRNPASFRREDVADRCVIIQLDRRSDFTSMNRLVEQIQDNRPRLLGEYIWLVGRIARELRELHNARDADSELSPPEIYRMADYAEFCRVTGRVLGWAPQDVEDMLAALQEERDAFSNEDDPLIGLINKWLDYRRRDGKSNHSRVVTIDELHAELESFAQAGAAPLKYSAKTLAHKIRSTYVERYFSVKSLAMDGCKFYQITRAQPQAKDA